MGAEYSGSFTPFDILSLNNAIISSLTKVKKLRESSSLIELMIVLKEGFPNQEKMISTELNGIKKFEVKPILKKVDSANIPVAIPKPIYKPRKRNIDQCGTCLVLKRDKEFYSAFPDYNLPRNSIDFTKTIAITQLPKIRINSTITYSSINNSLSFLRPIEIEKIDKPMKLIQEPVNKEESKAIENKDYEIKTLKYEIYSLQSIIESLSKSPQQVSIVSDDDTVENALRREMSAMRRGYEDLKSSLIDKIKKLNADYIHNVKASEREITRLKDLISRK